jgi:hypothetical protein
MSLWQTYLEIDFGEVGYWRGKCRLHVSLEVSPLAELIGQDRFERWAISPFQPARN